MHALLTTVNTSTVSTYSKGNSDFTGGANIHTAAAHVTNRCGLVLFLNSGLLDLKQLADGPPHPTIQNSLPKFIFSLVTYLSNLECLQYLALTPKLSPLARSPILFTSFPGLKFASHTHKLRTYSRTWVRSRA